MPVPVTKNAVSPAALATIAAASRKA